jgi:tetratricopeptide (TPR) repeat protein
MAKSPRRGNSPPNTFAAEARLNEGRGALQAGDPARAQAAFTDAIRFDDSLAEAHYELGNCWRRIGRPAEAERCLKAAIARDPVLLNAYVSLAFLYREQGLRSRAATLLLTLLAKKPQDVALHRQLSGLLADFGCYTEAAEAYERLTALMPATAEVLQRLGQTYQKLGRYRDAAAAFQNAIALDPDAGPSYLLLAYTRRMEAADNGLIERLEQQLSDTTLSQETIICLHFALGKLNDDLHRYAKAFRHFEIGNALKSKRQPFDRMAWKRQIEAIKQVFTAELFARANQVKPTPGPQPVFVVGMLRSGTTLAERILARHPSVYGAGELDLLDALATRAAQLTRLAYPACASRLNPAKIGQLGAEYKAQWTLEGRRARYVVDKNPLNFIHVGLAALVLPESRFVHCQRNPADTCLSIYFQNFAHTRNSYAYDLEDIADFYRGYRELMAHWERVLPGRLHPLPYEKLVAEPEHVSRELVTAVGLNWHPNCLEPHRHAGSISTASIWQARQPIYRGSVGRWRNYRAHIQPLLNTLGASEGLPLVLAPSPSTGRMR